MGAGESKHHRPSHRQKSPDCPHPPGKVILVPGTPKSDPDVITIKWERPEWNGGAKLTGYLVEQRRTGSAHWVRASPVLVRGEELTLSGLEPGMRYQFRVSAEGPGGRSPPGPPSEPIAVSYHRTFSSAPYFVRALKDTTAIENEQVEFTVEIEGTPNPKLVWYKDGLEVYSSRRQRIVNEGGKSTLIIHQAAFTDEGEIKCTATNKAGHIVTKSKLTLEAPPTIRLPRQYEDGLLFELGETVRLKISVAGRPSPKVTWHHNGETLTSNGRHEISINEKHTTLRIPEATRADRGEYQIKASNNLGEDIASFLVTITDRPLPPGKADVVMTLGRCVTLSWTPPDDDGGCKIGNYIVEYYRIGWNMWLKAATCRQLTTTLGDLIEGSEYKFRVKAENPYGMSDPSQESDVIFIPDPKRGLIEPPPRDKGKNVISSNNESKEWYEEARKHHSQILQAPKHAPLKREKDEEEMPSEVVLAHQVLRKVKMAPKRGWSEDSQGSPPREPSPPVPPQRKFKIKQPKLPEDNEEHQIEKTELDNHKESKIDNAKFRKMENNINCSSELMLVLLPGSRATTEERDAERKELIESLKSDDGERVAPPISLSAPELWDSSQEYGGLDLAHLRSSVSSSELMHEMAMARLFKEASEDEAEESLKRRYGIERRRSFEKRGGRTIIKEKNKEDILERKKNWIEEEGTNNGDNTYERGFIETEEESSSFHKEHLEGYSNPVRGFSERFLQSDRVFKEMTEDVELEEDQEEDESPYDWEEDESDPEEPARKRILTSEDYFPEEEEEEEETYHPRSMIPTAMRFSTIRTQSEIQPIPQVRTPSVIEPLPSPRIPIIRVNDLELQPNTRSSPPIMPPQPTSTDNQQSTTVLKPILKVREPPRETKIQSEKKPKKNFAEKIIGKMGKGETSSNRVSPKRIENIGGSQVSSSSGRKKVRIEEPLIKDEIYGSRGDREMVRESEREVLLTGEVARSRRRGKGVVGGETNKATTDPAQILANHYGELVREFGGGARPKSKMYLDYEDLKAAAERAEAEGREEKPKIEEPIQDIASQETTSNSLLLVPSSSESNPTRSSKTSTSIISLLDWGLFIIACYLYLFKDPRLALPLLALMVWRQANEGIMKWIPQKWRKTN